MNLFTGLRNKKDYKFENSGYWDGIKGEIGPSRKINGVNYSNGIVHERGPKCRLGALALTYKNWGVGVNSEWIRHGFQNIFAHHYISAQPGFQTLSNSILPYFQYQTTNPFTLW